MVNISKAGTSVIGHRSSSLVSKEKEASGIIKDNQIINIKFLKSKESWQPKRNLWKQHN